MDKRMLTMIALGFSSGFPLLLVFGTLNLWLKDAGISYAAIGLFSLVKTPYSFKWAWSPIIDRIKLPLFGRLGRRRGWALFIQIILLISILGMSTVKPADAPLTMAFFAVIVTIASASQDIVLDAYRIESFNSKEQGAGVAIFVLGYRFGLVFSGAGAIWMASVMDWNSVYKIMALGTIVGMLAILCSPEPAKDEKKAEISYTGSFRKRVKKFLLTAVYDPFKDFTRRTDWALILLFSVSKCFIFVVMMTSPSIPLSETSTLEHPPSRTGSFKSVKSCTISSSVSGKKARFAHPPILKVECFFKS